MIIFIDWKIKEINTFFQRCRMVQLSRIAEYSVRKSSRKSREQRERALFILFGIRFGIIINKINLDLPYKKSN